MSSDPSGQPGAHDAEPSSPMVGGPTPPASPDPEPVLAAVGPDPGASDSRTLISAPETPVSRAAESEAAGETAVKDGQGKKKGGETLAFLRELPLLLLVAFLLALVIKTFLIQAFYIPSESMEPTLLVGDRVLVNKVVYHLHPPRRGDIIVFADPHPEASAHRNPISGFWHWLTEGLGVSTNPDKDFIKRVIGLPGETVEIHRGVVMINGKPLNEPYLSPVKDIRDYGPVRVPANSLFVMGDNRTNSNDSRFSLGFIPYDKVIGRAFVVIWPPSRVRWLHGL